MQSATNAFDTAVTAAESDVRPVTMSAKLGTRDLTPLIESITVERSLSGDLPQEISLLAGQMSSRASLVLSQADDGGDGVSALDLLHPHSKHEKRIPSAQQPQQSVDVRLGMNGENLPQLTGSLRWSDWTEADGTVVVECLDGSSRVRASVSFPACGSYQREFTNLPATYPINTTALVAHVLNANNFRSTPPPDASYCAFSLPGVGGYVPEVGWMTPLGDGYGTIDPESDPASRYDVSAPCGPAQIPPPLGSGLAFGWFVNYPQQWVNTRGQFLLAQFFIDTSRLPAGTGVVTMMDFDNGDSNGGISVRVSRTKISCTVRPTTINSGDEYVAPGTMTPGWHHIAYRFYVNGTSGTPMTIEPFIDGVSQGTTVPAWSPSSGPMAMTLTPPTPMQAVQVLLGSIGTASASTLPTPLPNPMGWVPNAELDVGDLELDNPPKVVKVNSWDVLKAIAAAELGAVGFPEFGPPFFRSRSSLNGASTTPAKTLSTDLTARSGRSGNVDTVRNILNQKLRSKVLRDRGVGPDSWQKAVLTEPALITDPNGGVGLNDSGVRDDVRITFPPGVTTVDIKTDTPVLPYGSRLAIWNQPGQAWNASGLVFSEDLAGNVRNKQPASTIAFIDVVDQETVRLTVTNNTGKTLYAIWPQEFDTAAPWGLVPGKPSLALLGLSVLTDDESPEVTLTVRDQPSIEVFGEQTLDLDADEYRNRPDSVYRWLNRVLASTKTPTDTLSEISAPGDPRVQVGDVLLLTDVTERFADILARVMHINREATANGGLTDSYDLRTVS